MRVCSRFGPGWGGLAGAGTRPCRCQGPGWIDAGHGWRGVSCGPVAVVCWDHPSAFLRCGQEERRGGGPSTSLRYALDERRGDGPSTSLLYARDERWRGAFGFAGLRSGGTERGWSFDFAALRSGRTGLIAAGRTEGGMVLGLCFGTLRTNGVVCGGTSGDVFGGTNGVACGRTNAGVFRGTNRVVCGSGPDRVVSWPRTTRFAAGQARANP